MQPTSIVVTYPVTRQDIEATRQQYAALTFDSPAAYAAGTKAIAHSTIALANDLAARLGIK